MAKKLVQAIQEDSEQIDLLQDIGINCERISTQSASIDKILGGGLPLGRITEIYGTEGSGKTTFALHLLAEA